MNEDDSILFEAVTDEAAEARIVAWVLGEASGFEIAELERLCAEKPELAIFHRRMLILHGLIAEAEFAKSGEDWKLADERRASIAVTFGEPSVLEKRKLDDTKGHRQARRVIVGIAACLVFTFAVGGIFSAGEIKKSRKTNSATVRTAGEDEQVVSTRHGDLTELKKAVRDQEDKVEERRKSLSTVVRQKNITYRDPDSVSGNGRADGDESALALNDEKKDDAIKRGLHTQDYADAKRDYENDLDLLQRMKVKLLGETVGSAMSDTSSVSQHVAGSEWAQSAGATSFAPSKPEGKALSTGKMEDSAMIPAAPAASATPLPSIALADSSAAGSPEQERVPKLSKSFPFEPEPMLRAKTGQVREGIPRTSTDMVEGDSFIDTSVAAKDAGPYPAKESLSNIGTAGLGPEDQAINRNNTDAILNNPGRTERESDSPADVMRGHPSLTYEHTKNVDDVRRKLYIAEGNFNLGKYDEAKREYENVLRADAYNSAARRGLERVAGAKTDYDRAAYDHTRSELLSQVDKEWEFPTEFEPPQPGGLYDLFGKDAQTSMPLDWVKGMDATYEFKKSDKQLELDFSEIATTNEPFSTFSLSVSDVSFQLAKTALEKGERPDVSQIKVEQFYNAVDYGDPAPTANEPVAGVVEQSAHPIIPGRNLVRLGIRTGAAGRSAAQPLRLTLLIDQSGSMVREDRKAAMERTIKELGKLLTAADKISVIGFSRTPSLLAEGLAGNEMGKLGTLVNQEASEGGTNLEEAMILAGEIAGRQILAEAQNRIVLFTDGAANLGDADPVRLAERVKEMRQRGLAFDVAGIGADGLNDRLLAELAKNGNGRYYLATENIAAQLAGAFRPAAEDVKVQVKFNPERVSRYKLIGFEENRLKTEDFRNDAIDAAELAAEESAVALYQVELLPEGKGEIGEMSVRFREAGSSEAMERSWTIPHDAAAPVFERATPSMQLAGLAMLAGEKLKGGAMADAVDLGKLKASIATVKGYYAGSSKAIEMLRVVEMMRK